MATLSTLVKAVAEVQGLDENQVLWIARHLREDGLISQGGRGRGGAKMEALDAVNLLLGVNAPGTAKNTPIMVRQFRELLLAQDDTYTEDLYASKWNALKSIENASLAEAFQRHTPFSQTLEVILRCYIDGDEIAQLVHIELAGPHLTATISIELKETANCSDRSFGAVFMPVDAGYPNIYAMPDQGVSKSFTHRTLTKIGQVLAN